jgi:hypothetical protein
LTSQPGLGVRQRGCASISLLQAPLAGQFVGGGDTAVARRGGAAQKDGSPEIGVVVPGGV